MAELALSRFKSSDRENTNQRPIDFNKQYFIISSFDGIRQVYDDVVCRGPTPPPGRCP